ncbi:recombinase family protein [Methylotenera sp. L2L1]|jgi:DNA invertase Pin-like site-specific DNA recombinase|uniref:recombinase family protein n=1 Tax=Methylotenera sp. L2L1 TaxID=1502770 RepID=UPI0005665FD1|nr:recombinase family protein [Methylotenera sp. L2L1]
MTGQHVGYIRVSSIDQNTIRQLDGISLNKTFTEKLSGKDTKRPILHECLSYIRQGDTLHVHSIDRLARNAKDLLNLVEQILAKGATVSFNKNNLVFSPDSKDHMAKLQLTMLAAFAEFERELIRERQLEGIAIAKADGKYSGRRKVTDEVIEKAKARTKNGEPLSRVAKELNISRETLYKYGVRSALPFGNHVKD